MSRQNVKELTRRRNGFPWWRLIIIAILVVIFWVFGHHWSYWGGFAFGFVTAIAVVWLFRRHKKGATKRKSPKSGIP
jgi:multisubunit Na+/H+ antiporter MnhE subunit